MPKFGHFGSKFSKNKVKFEISTFEIGYMRNFVKIRTLILFAQNTQIWGLGLEIFKNK